MHRTLRLFTVMLVLPAGHAAALTWETLSREVRMEKGAARVVATFPFKNATERPVRIVSIVPSCDCLVSTLKKEVFVAGERGELDIEFTVGARSGRQEKTVTIATDEAEDSPTVLKLVVDIPEMVAISPRLLIWRAGEPLEEKTVRVVLAEPATASLREVQSVQSSFSARVEPDKEPGRYRIFVRPTGTAEVTQAPIRLTALVDGQARVFVIVAAVK